MHTFWTKQPQRDVASALGSISFQTTQLDVDPYTYGCHQTVTRHLVQSINHIIERINHLTCTLHSLKASLLLVKGGREGGGQVVAVSIAGRFESKSLQSQSVAPILEERHVNVQKTSVAAGL